MERCRRGSRLSAFSVSSDLLRHTHSYDLMLCSSSRRANMGVRLMRFNGTQYVHKYTNTNTNRLSCVCRAADVRVYYPLSIATRNDIMFIYTHPRRWPTIFWLSQVLPAAAELFLNLNEIVTQDQLIALNIL